MYRDGAAYCESVHDFVSRDLFTDVLATEEHHVDMLETQFEMIARMGLQNYVQLQSEAAESED
jgi:bacterioferritin